MKISEILAETGAQIGQIRRHTRGPYLIMSATRGAYTNNQNRLRNTELKRRLFQEYGLASIEQQGYWPLERDDSGNISSAGHEDSLFVPLKQRAARVKDIHEFLMVAKTMMIAYDQDSVIVNDGTATYMVSNPKRSKPPYMVRIGNTIRIAGRNQSLGDVPAWSAKKNYRYVVTDKERSRGLPGSSDRPQ